ncbi:MAG: hypothetical protein HOC44_24970 [Rhodospirillaceae bacterium]|nr:hypothetical protein [Rhodospirillaceae bacterium]
MASFVKRCALLGILRVRNFPFLECCGLEASTRTAKFQQQAAHFAGQGLPINLRLPREKLRRPYNPLISLRMKVGMPCAWKGLTKYRVGPKPQWI